MALHKTGLFARFGDERIFSSQDVGRGKPEPDLFLHAARQMGVPPERCAVVEDSPLGVQAAVAAGMDVYGFTAMTSEERSSPAPQRCSPTWRNCRTCWRSRAGAPPRTTVGSPLGHQSELVK